MQSFLLRLPRFSAICRGASGFLFSVMALGVLFPTVPAIAAEASAQAILGALSEGTRVGICSSQQQSLGSDCRKTVLNCSPSEWAKYIAANYQNRGGSIAHVSGGGATAGRRIADSEVTTDLANQAKSILTKHLASFPGCRPPDLSACGVGSQYPFTSGGASFVAKIERHYHPPGGAAKPWGDHPGVSLFTGTSGAGGGASPTAGEALPYLQADWERNSQTPPGPIQKSTCYCECQGSDTSDVCKGKTPGFPYLAGQDLTLEQCKEQCKTNPVATAKCSVPSAAPAGTSVSVNSSGSLDAFCFTPAECATQSGFFEAGGGCEGKGRCYAAEPVIKLNTALGSVTEIQGFNQYVVAAYRYLISIAAVAATVMFTWGAFLYLVGSAIPSISRGRQIMIDAIFGLVMVLGATTILRTINPATTNLNPLKVYMVNTLQFTNIAFCRDVPSSTKLALAGTRPSLTPYEDVAKNPNAFTIAPAKATCGSSYWVQGATGSSCDGSACPNRGEACVSCADGESDACNGKNKTDMVCQKTIFAGTVNYASQRHPEQVYMLALCNFAQPADPKTTAPDQVSNNWQLISGDLGKSGITAGGQTSDADVTGRATYRFNLEDDDLADAVSFCSNKGGLRGALLAVQYNDDTVKPEFRALASGFLTAVGGTVVFVPGGQLFGGAALVAAGAIGGTAPYDDLAILSKANCGAPRAAFDGYAAGTGIADEPDIARGMLCGFVNGKFLNGPGTYWSEQELRQAISGEAPILCDFTLNQNTAPSNPELCKAK